MSWRAPIRCSRCDRLRPCYHSRHNKFTHLWSATRFLIFGWGRVSDSIRARSVNGYTKDTLALRKQGKRGEMRSSHRSHKLDRRQLELFDMSELHAQELPIPKSAQTQKCLHDTTVLNSRRDKVIQNKSTKPSRKITPSKQPLDSLNSSERQACLALLDESQNKLRKTDGDSATTIVAIGYSALSRKAKVSPRTLTRALERLENKNIIKQHFPEYGRGQTTKSYQLFVDQLANVVAPERLSPQPANDSTPLTARNVPKPKPAMRTVSPRKKGKHSA